MCTYTYPFHSSYQDGMENSTFHGPSFHISIPIFLFQDPMECYGIQHYSRARDMTHHNHSVNLGGAKPWVPRPTTTQIFDVRHLLEEPFNVSLVIGGLFSR